MMTPTAEVQELNREPIAFMDFCGPVTSSWCWLFFVALIVCAAQTGLADSRGDCAIRLVDATDGSGIRFRHTDGGGGNRYIVESVVAGLALFDYDGDGLVDIYFLNGAPLRGTEVEVSPRNAMYRNNGDWTFTDVTARAGVGDMGYGLGVVAGDYDSDGDPDLYVNNFGPNVLYCNNGDGTFRDVSGLLPNRPKVGAGACFFDMEGDGDLDLYSANYVDFDYDNHIVRMIGPYQFHPGPRDYRGVPDDLFQNNGDGTFTNVARLAGIDSVAERGMGVIATDYDEDGDIDVFVCNDSSPNSLFRNDGRGSFAEVAMAAGVGVDLRGTANASMGVDCGDFDNDGHLDLFITSFSNESPVMYRNLGLGLFEDATNAVGARSAAFPHANWGTGLVDFDNDGDLDLFIANGHFMDNIRHIDDRTSQQVRNVLFMNLGNGRYVDVSDRCGDALRAVESSRAAGFADLDNDGDVDAVILNANSHPQLVRNESHSNNAWIELDLVGVQSNRDAAGARVEIQVGSLTQVAEVHLGRGYQSHYGNTLHFGLGREDRFVDRIQVRWPSGNTTASTDSGRNRVIVIQETPRGGN